MELWPMFIASGESQTTYLIPCLLCPCHRDEWLQQDAGILRDRQTDRPYNTAASCSNAA